MLLESKFRHKTRLSKQSRKEERAAYLFILIPVLGFLIFTFSATIYSLVLSFFDYNDLKEVYKFVGFGNYINLFQNNKFGDSVLNTIALLLSIPLGVTIGLLLAVYLKKLAHGSKLLSFIYYLPAVTSAVAINIVWRYLFNTEFGLLNKVMGINVDWFDPRNFWNIKIAIMIRGVWGGIGATMILYLAGLNNIPNDYYESSSIDGANRWQQLVHITIPLVSPTTFYLLVTSIIGGLQSFADAQIFASGNQQAQTVVYYIWTYGIYEAEYGIASAASVILAVCICIITIIQFKRTKMLDL